jgi:hypothetical protein
MRRARLPRLRMSMYVCACEELRMLLADSAGKNTSIEYDDDTDSALGSDDV